jgi:hypothetical protein
MFTRNASILLILSVFILVSLASGMEQHPVEMPFENLDDRPPVVVAIHNLTNLWSALYNLCMWGDPFGNYYSMEWSGGEGSSYLWCGDLWSSCYGNITPVDSTDKTTVLMTGTTHTTAILTAWAFMLKTIPGIFRVTIISWQWR